MEDFLYYFCTQLPFWASYLAAFNITLKVNLIKFNTQQSVGRED